MNERNSFGQTQLLGHLACGKGVVAMHSAAVKCVRAQSTRHGVQTVGELGVVCELSTGYCLLASQHRKKVNDVVRE